jgi:hypothetical protein
MNSNILKTNKIYKAKILEMYTNNLYKIAIKVCHCFYNYYSNFICKIENNNINKTELNTLLNQYHQELYIKVIAINKIINVEIKIKELNQYINLF